MKANLVLVEATIYDNITEANGRQEVLNALREQAAELERYETARQEDARRLEHRFVTCTWCGWRLDYEADGREAAHATANEHALSCKADPRTAERDAMVIVCAKAAAHIIALHNKIKPTQSDEEIVELIDNAILKGGKG